MLKAGHGCGCMATGPAESRPWRRRGSRRRGSRAAGNPGRELSARRLPVRNPRAIRYVLAGLLLPLLTLVAPAGAEAAEYIRSERTAPDDAENYTNRSPYPTLHILREDSLAKAIDATPDIDEVPERNIRTMQSLSAAQLKTLFGR